MRHGTQNEPAGSSAARVLLGVMGSVCLLIGMIACESGPFRTRSDAPVQAWWEERGPVVPHDSFPRDCSTCHLGPGWETVKEDFEFDHEAETGVPLVGAHQRAECLRCHNDRGPVEVFASLGCQGCHEDPHQRQLGVDCESCHTQEIWSVKGDIGLHNRTRFPLVGAHAAAACFSCHEGAEVGNFSYVDVECISCHQDDLKSATSPDHLAQGWVTSCDDCHIPTDWSSSNGGFNHSFFPLVGNHAAASCESCHEGQDFNSQPTDCASCHLTDYQLTSSPNHLTAGFPTSCELCHTPFGFEGAGFDHAQFPLTGSHLGVDCASCHENDVFAGTSNDCASCHLSEYNATTDPDHQVSGFSTSCEKCHTPTSWDTADFNHQFFPLTGAHMGVDCESCHLGGVFEGTSSDCASCHLTEFNQASDPNHQAAGFPTLCDQCHTPTIWPSTNYDHAQFPLTGAHQAASCEECHQANVYVGTQNDCASCHLSDYQQTNSPDHQAAGFPASCELCHTPVAWNGAVFDHTQYPLTGAHLGAQCEDCHVGGVYQGTPNDCAACHLGEYQQTTDPDHQSAGFPTDCKVCHEPFAWEAANFQHTQFPLTGAHAAPSCSECHVNEVYVGTSSDCVSCHLSEYNQTTDPNHAQAGFPTDCAQCHEPFSWQTADFNHSQFPLTGGHQAVDCESCHIGGVFQGTPNDCASCHLSDYNGTTNPDHQDAGFPTSCETCHNSNGWTGANFNHSQWPLTGAHSGTDCASCHINGVYEGTPTNCAACHLTDYNNTNNPNHQAAGFPTNCQTCHNTNGWNGANFDHDFPINSGAHKNISCQQCHTNPGNYGNFSCTDCHEHNKNKMDNEHDDVGGYSYNSNACYNCHPNGKD